jgi:hypothetical protein
MSNEPDLVSITKQTEYQEEIMTDKMPVDSVEQQAKTRPDTIKETGWEDEEWHELTEGEPIFMLRDIPKEQAKQEVRTLLASSSKPLDHGEIADELSLELRLVAHVCEELIKEGVIEFT